MTFRDPVRPTVTGIDYVCHKSSGSFKAARSEGGLRLLQTVSCLLQ
jgi:hypothetical protein